MAGLAPIYVGEEIVSHESGANANIYALLSCPKTIFGST